MNKNLENLDKEYDRCLRCGRKLKNPDARKLGYGAVCWKKRQASGTKLLLDAVNRRTPTSQTLPN